MTTEWRKIVGHEWAVEMLAGAIQHRRIGHAYLITGPAQVGKTTLAITFAMALNCLSDVARPCGRCRACTLIAAGRHPDVSVIEPEINSRGKKTIKIATMRDLQRKLQLAAVEARHKVGIISEFDAANTNAANAFLKTLEEPPGDTVLILTATEADALLDTIKSRCRVAGIRPIPTPQIQQALVTRWHVPAEQAHLLAHLANGRLGWAVNASQHPELIQKRLDQLALLHEVLGGTIVERFKHAEKLAKQPEKLFDLLNTWLTWWRDLLMLLHDIDTLINVDERVVLQKLKTAWEAEQVVSSLQQTKAVLWQLERNVSIRLALENLFLTYPRMAKTEV